MSRASDMTMVVKEEAPVKDAKGRKTVRPKRDEEVRICQIFFIFFVSRFLPELSCQAIRVYNGHSSIAL